MSTRRRAASRSRLGAHMSIAGGIACSVERALEVDATALQVFVKSARQWEAPPLDPGDADRFRAAAAAAGLGAVTVAHASYLLNPASPDRALRERSIRALGDELDRCARLGIPYLVMHPGSHVGEGEARGLDRIARALDRVLAGRRARGGDVTLLLENTAGQGSNLGHRFEHLARILDASQAPERLGVCIDTCHLLAAGYEFRDRPSYLATMRELDAAVGLARVRAFHLNDSRHPLGSRRDRHEHIGRGEVGLEAFRLLLNDRRFRDRPMLLETPKGEDGAEDRVNLAVLRAMLPESRR